MKKSWQTTMAGAASALGVILSVFLPALGVELAEGKVDELAGALVFFAGLIWMGWAARDDNVTSEGRTAPKSPKAHLWLLVFLLPAVLGIPACGGGSAGGAARQGLLTPAARAAWPGVMADAEYGVDAKVDAGVLGEHAAESNRERIRLFDEAVRRMSPGGGS